MSETLEVVATGAAADAVRARVPNLVEDGFALTRDAVEDHAALIDALDCRPDRLDLRWRLGVDGELAEQDRRRTELANFIRHVAARPNALPEAA